MVLGELQIPEAFEKNSPCKTWGPKECLVGDVKKVKELIKFVHISVVFKLSFTRSYYR